MAPILGILASGISGHLFNPTGNYYSIATTTVGSGGTSTITFSSIPSTYTHLQLRFFIQETRGDYGIAGANMTFNSDTGTNYSYHQINGDGSSAGAGSGTSQNSMRICDGDFGTNQATGGLVFGVGVLDILDYTNTNKYKVIRHLSGVDINGTVLSVGGRVGLFSGLWMNTNAITSISITPNGGSDFRQYSQVALYGVK